MDNGILHNEIIIIMIHSILYTHVIILYYGNVCGIHKKLDTLQDVQKSCSSCVIVFRLTLKNPPGFSRA